MTIIYFLAMLSIIALGVITTYSDMVHHKAYNKDLAIFACVGIAIQVLCIFCSDGDLTMAVINIMLTFLVSFVFFATRIWAAGDAKLFTVMILLIPRQLYGGSDKALFPAFVILGLAFALALFYVMVESIILFFNDARNQRLGNYRRFLPKFSIRFILSWAMGYLAINTFDSILMLIDESGFLKTMPMIFIINILFVMALFSIIKSLKLQVIVAGVCILLRVCLNNYLDIELLPFSISTVIVVVCIMFIRSFTGQYDYRVIPTSSVREGQILAKQTLIFMIPSAVKGIPKWTDESTRCRLDSEAVVAIKRWEKSKYGQSTITIVRHIPFAPFIFIGTIIYLLVVCVL